MKTAYYLSLIGVLISWIFCNPCIARVEDQAAATKAIGIEQIKASDHIGENRYALVIGINDYADRKIPDLKTGEDDAKAVYELLTDPCTGGVEKSNAYLLLGEQATTRNIRQHLYKLRQIPSKSTVFIYFSGHGAKEGDGACWVTQDCILEMLGATGLTNIDLQQFISRIPSDRVVVILDCCYAAATVKEGKAIEGDFSEVLRKFTGKGRAYLMAAGSGEEAIEAKGLKRSVFTHYLVEGMKGKADGDRDGVVVLTELTSYIDCKVADEARIRGCIQRPVVRMDNVTEPSKFRLTIDAERIARNIRETAEAKAKDNKEEDKEALNLLEEALKLYPDNFEALALQKKIIGYYGPNPGDVVTNSIGMKLMWIPPGEFMMGSRDSAAELAREYSTKEEFFTDEHPQHKINISKDFGWHSVKLLRHSGKQ